MILQLSLLPPESKRIFASISPETYANSPISLIALMQRSVSLRTVSKFKQKRLLFLPSRYMKNKGGSTDRYNGAFSNPHLFFLSDKYAAQECSGKAREIAQCIMSFPSLSSFTLITQCLRPMLGSLVMMGTSTPSVSLLRRPITLSPITSGSSCLNPKTFSITVIQPQEKSGPSPLFPVPIRYGLFFVLT